MTYALSVIMAIMWGVYVGTKNNKLSSVIFGGLLIGLINFLWFIY